MTRLRRALDLAAALAPVVVGIVAGAASILYLFDKDWIPALWAALATALAFVVTEHHCPAPPAPEPVQRGLQCVHFIGGPEDGGQAIVSTTGRDLHRATLCIEGSDYDVATIDRTCYRAELTPSSTLEAGDDR